MDDQAERIVNEAVKAGAQDAVAEVVADRSYQIRFAQNEPVIVNKWRRTVGSVFLVRDRRAIGGEVTNFDKIPQTIHNLISAAKATPENPDYRGIAKGPFTYRRSAVDKKITGPDDRTGS